MNIGELRDRVTLQQQDRVSDGQGGFTLSWSDVATVWANVQAISGREYLLAQQLGTALSHEVHMRYRAGMAPSMRLVTSDGVVLDVHSVANPDGVKREHLLLCEQVQPSVD